MKTARNSHVLDVVEYLRAVLTFSGTWPQRNPSWSYRMKKIFSWCLDISIHIFLFVEMRKNYQNDEIKELTETLSVTTSYFSWLIKRTIFEFKFNTLISLFEKLEDPVLHDFPTQCYTYVHKENRFTMIMAETFQFFAANMVTLSAVKPFMNAGLALNFSVFELGKWYYPIHCYEVITMANTCYNNSTMDCVAMSLVSIGSTQFEILKEKIINCRQWAGRSTEEIDRGVRNTEADMDPRLDATIKNYLNDCAKHHLKILEYEIIIKWEFRGITAQHQKY